MEHHRIVANNAENLDTRSLEIVFPEQSNHYGTLFAGNALSIMTKSAFVAASRYARSTVVMAASEDIALHRPVKVGELLDITAQIISAGRSSVKVQVLVVTENLITGDRNMAMEGRFVMVSVDQNGKPTPHSSIN